MELSISDNAAIEFNKSVEGMNPKPYLRVGARPGGCSGWTFTLDTDDYADITDNVFINEEHDIRMVIDIEHHENIIGNLRIEYNRTNLWSRDSHFSALVWEQCVVVANRLRR